MIIFKIYIDNAKTKTQGELWYIKDEYSIFFKEKYHCDSELAISLLIGTLELLVSDHDKRIAFAAGFLPHTAWNEKSLPLFSFVEGAMYIDDNFDPKDHKGICYKISDDWPIYYDNASGYVFVGKDYSKCLKCIEFCTGCYVSISNGYINGLWLKPKIIETFSN